RRGVPNVKRDRVHCAGLRPTLHTAGHPDVHGDCFDNAMMESFFSILEAEVLDINRFTTREEARRAVFSWLAGWYNVRRRHSGVGYLSPQKFEKRFTRSRRRPSAESASD